MTQQWYQVLSLVFGYAAAAIIVLIVLIAARRHASDRALHRRVRRNLPQAGAAGTLKVLSGSRRLAAGEEIHVPYEGTMGSGHSCDVCIPVRRVHMRSAFFWMDQGALHMAALHRDGFSVDDVPVEPGDEAVLRHGAVLRVGEAKLVLSLYTSRKLRTLSDGPYVTSARRGQARQGRGDGVGAPGRGEERREKKLQRKQAARQEGAAREAADQAGKKAGGKRIRR